jgi:hypothetical protein
MILSRRSIPGPSVGGVSALVAAALLGPFASPAQALVRCIDSDIQIDSVLDAALASTNTIEDVRIKQGNFVVGSGQDGYFGVLQGTGKTLSISGGWIGAPGQCSTQTSDASSTVFWGQDQRPVFGVAASTTFTGTLMIENMTFLGGYSDASPTPSCLSLGEQNGGRMTIRIDRVRIQGCSTAPGVAAPAAGMVSSTGLTLRNSLIADNDVGTEVPINTVVRGGAGWVLNNTFADNLSANVNGYVGINASGSNGALMTLANNIFDGNVATAAARRDIRIGTGVNLINNRYTGLAGVPNNEVGSTTGPAGLVPGEYALTPTSTARDAGAAFADSLQGTRDLANAVRVGGTSVDLGALEFPGIFSDGLEAQ